ncbi:LmeA family phospholipid-binding protein [Cellulomonas sp. ATA003]|uniref:LmeA family phospholipid-binding protein n=1 Tax=Cellulomonas sp. ATA003 TaxID=3073064 RepID=UPI0028735084|nr:LmeA family phospholipid-binding protein [Cellulomonas sp. ATA003]WNB85842.1 LmeA family phospholipid-binding protein [Cellulomonas sp. ATA003]
MAATGTIEVERGRLVIEPRSVDIGGPDLLSGALGGIARRLVTIDQDVEGLPEGLVLQDVVVQDDGFRATLRGDDVVLAQ